MLAENGRHSAVGWTDGAARFALLSTLVLVIGALGFPLSTGASVGDGRWRRWCSFVVVAAAVSAGFALVVQVPTSVGAGWSAITSGDAWRAFIQTTAGKAAVVGFVLLVAVAVSFLTTRRTVGLSPRRSASPPRPSWPRGCPVTAPPAATNPSASCSWPATWRPPVCGSAGWPCSST